MFDVLGYQKRRSALSGINSSDQILNQIISSELDNEANNLSKYRAVQEQQRQNDVVNEESEKARQAQATSQLTGTATQLGTAYALSDKTFVGDAVKSGISAIGNYINPGASSMETASLVSSVPTVGSGTGLITAAPSSTLPSVASSSGLSTTVTPTISAAPVIGEEIASIGSASAPGVLPLSQTGTMGAAAAANSTPSALSSAIGSAAGPAAIVAGAETVRSLGGGKGKGYDEKTYAQKQMDSPLTAGTTAALSGGIPFATNLAKEGTFVGDVNREAARIERQVMSPIDWLFGNTEYFGGK